VRLILEVTEADRRVVPRSAEAWARAQDGAGEPVRLELRADAGLLVAELSPARALPADHAGWIEVEARFDAGGEAVSDRLRVHATGPAAIPARFSGAQRDLVRDGSLVVAVGVDVDAPGFYVIDANLLDEAGAPVAWARGKRELGAGAGEVELSFFGKAILDGWPADGRERRRFRLAALRGLRWDRATGEVRALPPPPAASGAGDGATSEVDRRDLSAADWDSAHKRATAGFLAD
jgi:hypothetical protein